MLRLLRAGLLSKQLPAQGRPVHALRALAPRLMSTQIFEVKPDDTAPVLTSESTCAALFERRAILVQRRLEALNLILGFEQANVYEMYGEDGTQLGYITEETSMLSTISRQLLRLRRPFKADILDLAGNVLLRVRRPFYFINSTITVEDGEGQRIGEVHQRWHLWRRKYDLFLKASQFGVIDSGLLSWNFVVEDEEQHELARVDKNFTGFVTEIFTDARRYAVWLEAPEELPEEHATSEERFLSQRLLRYDERAVLLAAAVSIDFDYFSRHSEGGGGSFLRWSLLFDIFSND